MMSPTKHPINPPEKLALSTFYTCLNFEFDTCVIQTVSKKAGKSPKIGFDKDDDM